MKPEYETDPRASLALTTLESCLDMVIATVPAPDDTDLHEADVAFDDGDLAEVPQALAAYIYRQRWLYA